MKQITIGELLLIQDTLHRMQDELEAIDDIDHDYIVTSGVEEGIKESLMVVDSLIGGSIG